MQLIDDLVLVEFSVNRDWHCYVSILHVLMSCHFHYPHLQTCTFRLYWNWSLITIFHIFHVVQSRTEFNSVSNKTLFFSDVGTHVHQLFVSIGPISTMHFKVLDNSLIFCCPVVVAYLSVAHVTVSVYCNIKDYTI